ncbi:MULTISPECIES: hypothetical protein [unclassified Treponema]|uniref:hypothetical protein n=1 Tax=unclassified Treponema TaxID=2638727 RepID=UPI0020A5BB93|nr:MULTISPECIES: hypothetical protein [unclassified Treponema]UTC66589.1 hypothetical protein E4O06_11610 [Treponema sp. OMZ 789]UTC69322.1 hypothetical protein E4O01_11750 [Treponema sp. OMZ 790]UTC72036.1 hypothetical protein E4O02_11845 [Treponema sp. OMZ 791]
MAKEINTLKEFLESEIYSELIRLTNPARIEEKIRDIEISRLHDRLKQRQFLLKGFTCKLSTEKELTEWYLHLIEENKSDIILWTKEFWKYSEGTPEEYPDGEFPPGEELGGDEKSKVRSVGKYTKSCLAMYMAEFEILKNHPEILPDYYKRLRIPGAVKYAKEMKKLFARTFGEE